MLVCWSIGGQGLTMGKVTREKKAGASCGLLPSLLCWKAYEGSHSPGWWVMPPFRGT